MPEAGAATVNEVADDCTTGPVTRTSYFPGERVAGSLRVRDQAPELAAKVLLTAVFLPPCRLTVIVRLAGPPTVPVTVMELLLSLPDFHVSLSFGFAIVVVGSGGTGGFEITIWRVAGVALFL